MVVAVVAAVAWFWTRPSKPAGGDPGGRLLAQVAPVATAVPGGVDVDYRYLDEPRLDECDGQRASRGWDPVVVQVGFVWAGPSPQLFDVVGQKLQALGWTPATDGGVSGSPARGWTKRLTNGTQAFTDLSAEPAGRSWTLLATAPPVGKPVTGC